MVPWRIRLDTVRFLRRLVRVMMAPAWDAALERRAEEEVQEAAMILLAA